MAGPGLKRSKDSAAVSEVAGRILFWATAYAAPTPSKCANLRREIEPKCAIDPRPPEVNRAAALSAINSPKPNWSGGGLARVRSSTFRLPIREASQSLNSKTRTEAGASPIRLWYADKKD